MSPSGLLHFRALRTEPRTCRREIIGITNYKLTRSLEKGPSIGYCHFEEGEGQGLDFGGRLEVSISSGFRLEGRVRAAVRDKRCCILLCQIKKSKEYNFDRVIDERQQSSRETWSTRVTDSGKES